MKKKWINHIIEQKNNAYQKLIYLSMLMFSSPAFAEADVSQDTIEAALAAVIAWLTGTIGLSAGTLAIIGAGFVGLTGRMPISFLKTIGIGLGVIYSAAFLASMVTGQG